MPTKNFDTILSQNATEYSKALCSILSQFTSTTIQCGTQSPIERSLIIESDYIASIPFVGTVTGEFLLALSREQVAEIFPEMSGPDEARGLITEILNMAAGLTLNKLESSFPKLTMSPPRILSGRTQYPNLKNIKFTLRGPKEDLIAYLYVDQMRLDIADSYRGVIVELTKSNEDLSVANRKLIDQQTQLIHSEKMASLGMMAAGVAHEINNPLAFVVSNSDVLNSYIEAMRALLVGYDQLLSLVSTGRSAEAKTELVKIQEMKKKEDIGFILEDTHKLLAESKFGLERICSIVNGLKRFSRVDDTGVKIIQINEEIQNTLMLLQNELKYKCQVQTQFDSRREIECLPGELSQVFLNLIVNAGQAIKGKDGLIRISTTDTETMLKIEIADNGDGITPENLPKIFSPFFTTKPVGEGTGLGLAITHGIVHKHGGKLGVQSQVGIGTTFTIELPYKKSGNLLTQTP